MRLLLKVNANDEHWEGARHGCVEITPQRARNLLAKIALYTGLKAVDSALFWTHYSDYSVNYLENYDDEGGVVEDGEVVTAPEDFVFDDTENAVERTECDMVVVDESGVRWRAYPKYGDQTLETATVTKEFLEEIAAEGEGLPRPLADLKKILMELGNRLVTEHGFDPAIANDSINLEELEQILFCENSVIANEDVPGLMTVLRKVSRESGTLCPNCGVRHGDTDMDRGTCHNCDIKLQLVGLKRSTAAIKNVTWFFNLFPEAREELAKLGFDWSMIRETARKAVETAGRRAERIAALLEHTMTFMKENEVSLDNAVQCIEDNARDDKPVEYFDGTPLAEIEIGELDGLFAPVVSCFTCPDCGDSTDVIVADGDMLECRTCVRSFEPVRGWKTS